MAAVVRELMDGRGRERCHGAGEGRLAELQDKWEADEAKGRPAPLGLLVSKNIFILFDN